MSKQKILIAEDETQLLELYKELLVSEHFAVDTVANGKNALQLMKKKKYDLVLLDIRMPEMDGLQVSKEVAKKTSVYHSPKLVFLTNLSQNEVISDALHSGVTGYLIKGKLTPEELVEEVRKFVSYDKK